MTNLSETVTDEDDLGPPTLPWEVPEIASIVVLVAFGALVVGGLVAGIVLDTELNGPIQSQLTGEAIEFGTTWAEPLLAIALLGIVSLAWWQVEAWANKGEDSQYDDYAARGHIERAGRIGLSAQAALLVTVAGSIAALVGETILNNGSGAGGWSRDILAGAALVGVLAITTGGLWIGRRARAVALDTAR
jgi:hypothetical protein